MASLYDIPAGKFNEELAKELKSVQEINPPEWSKFVRSGAHKERPPMNKDWWYIRSASVLATVFKSGPIGVSKLRSKYGGRRNRGVRPEMFTKGSGAVIRNILQQLQKAGLIQYKQIGVHKGRIISSKGQAILDKTANKLAKELKLRIEVKMVESKAKKPIMKDKTQTEEKLANVPKEEKQIKIKPAKEKKPKKEVKEE